MYIQVPVIFFLCNTSNKNYNNQKCTSRLQVEYVITKSNPKSYVHIKSNPKYKIKS